MRQGTHALVTGGAGFIGSNLVDRLLGDGYAVEVVDDLSRGSLTNLAQAADRVALHEMDVRSPDLRAVFASARPEIVMHLAAQIDVRVSVADPGLDADINILGSLNVLEHAREIGARKVLVASSGGCIYGEDQLLPIPESAVGVPASPYGISKKVLGDYLAFYRSVHGMDSAIMALSNVYGPRQDPHGEAGVVAIFLKAMLEDRPTTIYGDGSQTRDFVYVGDVADAFARAIEAGAGIYNIGTGVETSVLELWRACAAATGYEGEPRFAPARAGELARNALDSTRARTELGWRPQVDLQDGIARTAEFIAGTLSSAR